MSLSNNSIYCQTCHDNPGAHSFKLLNPHPGVSHSIFYTKIADAKQYNDTAGILAHYRQLLELVNPGSWIWIFDCAGLELKHCFEIRTASGICDIIRGDNRLTEIRVVNANKFFAIILAVIRPFLDTGIKSKLNVAG